MDGPDHRQIHRKRRFAVAMLLLSCVFWGGSFAWQKSAGDAINLAAGLPVTHGLGQLLLLSGRFFIASVIWLIVFPRSLHGWSMRTVFRSMILGGVFGIGMILQATGLARTTASLSAFLTSLTILFVPLIMTVALKKSPTMVMWAGVAIATVGIYLFTGATSGFNLGALLGLGCAVVFSTYLILLNRLSVGQSPWRLMFGQLVVVMLVSLLATVMLYPHLISHQAIVQAVRPPVIWNVLLLAIVATILANGLMVFYQPLIDPTRAAMIYLTEPIFASVFAYFLIEESLSIKAMAGGAMILFANLLVEIWEIRSRRIGPARVQ